MAHDQLRLDLLDRVHRDTDHDEQAGTAEEELQAQPRRDETGDDLLTLS